MHTIRQRAVSIYQSLGSAAKVLGPDSYLYSLSESEHVQSSHSAGLDRLDRIVLREGRG